MVSSGVRDLAFIAAICALCFMEGVSGFGSGAPASTCFTRYPKHQHTPTQTGESPYKISLTPSSYRPGDTIDVEISRPDDRPFRGFQMAGFREPLSLNATCQPLEIVGQFQDVSDGKSKIFTCVGATGSIKNMVTHQNNDDAASVKFKWTAPSYNAGNIIFQATVVENYRSFWTNVEATLSINPAESTIVSNPKYEDVCVEPLNEIDFSGCGDTKACFLYPRHCQDDDCVAAVSFEYRAKTDDYLVEMYADPGSEPGYVGVAFSKDDRMADNDETFVCAGRSVQHGYNPGKYNERVVTNDLLDAQVKDGRLQCRFVMPHNSSVIRIKPSTIFGDNPEPEIISFDKSVAWRIQLAWGPIMPDSNVITLHKDMPATTSSSVVIKEVGTYRGTAFHVLVQVHAALMIVAWTFLSGIVTVIARHYKDMMSRKRLLGTKIWFQVHRALAILVAILTGIGLIVIFSHYGTPIRKAADPHAYWGLAVAVAVGLQIVAGMLRPGADHKLRIFFNWGHRILGQASHVIAAVTMFLAFKIDYVSEDMHSFGFITLGIWVGVQLMWHICFEIVSCIMERNESDSYQVDNSKETSESWTPAVLLIIYVLFLAACCISVLCAFLFY